MDNMEDGIYFGVPEDEYHQIQRFSGSGARDMLISPATFWAGSWFNPENAPDPDADEEPDEEATAAQIAGRAYHKARLEPALYHQIYVRGINPKEHKKILMTGKAIAAEFEKLGLPKSKAGETVLDAAKRLRASGYAGPIIHLLQEDLRAGMEEFQIEIPWKLYDQIEADIQAVHGNPEVAGFLQGGQAEITVLWTDKAGVKWKARLDYLQVQRIPDFKTFGNTSGKNVEQCLYDAVAYNRYYIQAFVYWTAAELIRGGELPIKKRQNQAQTDLIEAIRKSPDPFEFWWIWQEKNGVPNVMARRLVMTAEVHPHYLAAAPDDKSREALRRKLRKPSMIWQKADLETQHARNLFLQCQEVWPTGPWGAMTPVGDIDDEGFSRYWLEK